jgi:hypothetical protein
MRIFNDNEDEIIRGRREGDREDGRDGDARSYAARDRSARADEVIE